MFIKIADVLLDKGYKVYSIGQHSGTCNEPYVVIKESIPGGTLNKSLNQKLVDIFPFYPMGRYTNVVPFIEKLKTDLNEVSGLENVNQPEYILVDDTKVAYTTKLSYRIIKSRR